MVHRGDVFSASYADDRKVGTLVWRAPDISLEKNKPVRSELKLRIWVHLSVADTQCVLHNV